jgi:hypothetical protein
MPYDLYHILRLLALAGFAVQTIDNLNNNSNGEIIY